jgi:NAD-dependent deacetylase
LESRAQYTRAGYNRRVSDDLPARLAAALEDGGRVVVLTGAGVSAESGIPTFRGKDGFWTVGSKVYHPQEMATQAAFRAMPDDVWHWYLCRLGGARSAEPNAAHRALVELERALGDRFLLVTQNVDGLHLRAGSTPERTYQIHGNVDFMRCSAEHGAELVPMPYDVLPVAEDAPLPEPVRGRLVCPRCGARTRPHVLWFDEYYDEELFRFQSSLRAAATCALLVTIGTSGVTNLPDQMIMAARRAGALLIDVNPEEGPFAQVAQSAGGLWLAGAATERVPPLAEAIARAAA